ncbi:hypothetical protein DASC09_041360 [Saccharomycopsis crataegensis]|uniref:Uncharacterized protein n=1 Tax=Saccharomycopsis crataegensis TaxID=43959 RepID=A0AAV5QQG5_9ASCO|nr:hypothetical protein DASC09_041360 [Saccharomycopsis crataegensis]
MQNDTESTTDTITIGNCSIASPNPLQEIDTNTMRFKTFRVKKSSSKTIASSSSSSNQDENDGSNYRQSLVVKTPQNLEVSLEADIAKLEKLYRQELVKSSQLNNERELLEVNLLSKEKIILSQQKQIKTTQELLNNYKKNINDELTFFENDYKIWLEEKQSYESKISALQKLLARNGIEITRPESVHSQNNLTNDIDGLLEENNAIRAQIDCLHMQINSLTNKSSIELSFKDNLMIELEKLTQEKESYLETIESLKAELEEATKQFTDLNENISFHQIFNNNNHNDIQSNFSFHLEAESNHGSYSSEVKLNHKSEENKEMSNTLDKEISSFNSTEYSNISTEFKNLEKQYKSQNNVLTDVKFELNSAKQENQQLFFFINQLIIDNDNLQSELSKFNHQIELQQPSDPLTDVCERNAAIKDFINSSKNDQSDNDAKHKSSQEGSDNLLTKLWNRSSIKDINNLITKNKKVLMKKNMLRASSMSATESINSEHSSSYSHNQPLTRSKTSNFRYFKKNNRISRIISNNIDSNYSLRDDKKKRNTIIGVMRHDTASDGVVDECNQEADESIVLNLKPLKISKHSRKNSDLEDLEIMPNNHGSDAGSISSAKMYNVDEDVGNVSLNASIDLKNLQTSKFNRRIFLNKEVFGNDLHEPIQEKEEGTTEDMMSLKSEISFESSAVPVDDSVIYHGENIISQTIDNDGFELAIPDDDGEIHKKENILDDVILEESSSIMDDENGGSPSYSNDLSINILTSSDIYDHGDLNSNDYEEDEEISLSESDYEKLKSLMKVHGISNGMGDQYLHLQSLEEQPIMKLLLGNHTEGRMLLPWKEEDDVD